MPQDTWRLLLRKRYYVLLVARDGEGQLRKIPIPLHYIYVFLAGALIGMFTITGMAGSYTRMLMKVARFNQLRTEKEALKSRYSKLEKVAQEKEIQAASLGSLAGEALANTYYPKGSRGAGDIFVRYASDQGWRFGANMLRQYWPRINKKLRLVPPVPEPTRAAKDPAD